MNGFTALVLAGSRGEPDALSQYAGVSHKALIALGGETLLARVLRALDEAGAGRIALSTSDPEVVALAGRLRTRAPLDVLPAAGSPSLSVSQGAEALGTPLLVTTVDHALLRPEWITGFLADVPADADIAALLAEETVVRAAVPDTQRTYLAFRDGRYSGCNLFFLRNARALSMIALWRQVEADRKRPWKIAARLGVGILVRYLLGLMTLDQMVTRLCARAGARGAAVRSPYGLAAVDVDKPADLDLVRRLLIA